MALLTRTRFVEIGLLTAFAALLGLADLAPAQKSPANRPKPNEELVGRKEVVIRIRTDRHGRADLETWKLVPPRKK